MNKHFRINTKQSFDIDASLQKKMHPKNMSTEDILCDLKIKILNDLRHQLCKDILVQRHFSYLRSKYVLTQQDEQMILHECTDPDRASKFLDILCQKGSKGFDSFCESLREDQTQIHLLKKLHIELELGMKDLFDDTDLDSNLQSDPPDSPEINCIELPLPKESIA
eukprot:GHVT01055298.1.p1 GENE.GHVT01055298.1~~GHVT01055298.1.p1  ORF type:complete len:166 (-),score=5.73 GHVT01055298.1:505-1002(-)